MPFIDIREIDQHEPFPGFKVQRINSTTMMLAFWEIEADGKFPEHSHPHEQVMNVVEGKIELTISGETRVLGPGTVAIIPPNAVHSGRAVTHCKMIDVNYPIYEDCTK